MQITLALLADHANVTAENKLNILGIFDRIAVTQFPAVHSQLQLVLRFDAHHAEKDRAHPVEIQLREPDGETIFELSGEIVPRGGAPGEVWSSNQIITIANLKLRREGGHTFVVFVDNDLKAEVPLRIELMPDLAQTRQRH